MGDVREIERSKIGSKGKSAQAAKRARRAEGGDSSKLWSQTVIHVDFNDESLDDGQWREAKALAARRLLERLDSADHHLSYIRSRISNI